MTHEIHEYPPTITERSMLEIAVDLARSAHVGQADKLGVDYIQHPLAVMGRVSTEDENIVAVLHDRAFTRESPAQLTLAQSEQHAISRH